MSTSRSIGRIGCLTAAFAFIPAAAVGAGKHDGDDAPALTGRAVLPVETYAEGPPSGSFFAGQTINGISFPLPSQPVEGFSGIVEGRHRGEILAMADNGFGNKANSRDFLIRAYWLDLDMKTADGGSGGIGVDGFVQFSDPWDVFPYDIVHEGTADRLLTGADIDPESIQRDKRGDLWVGDEFGPWILHFDAWGRLLEAPISLPDGLRSPSNPGVPAGGATVGNSRGLEAMAMSPNGRRLTVVLEGAVPGDDPLTRRVYRYDTRRHSFVRLADYRAEAAGHFVADVQARGGEDLVVIERDGPVVFRRVYVVNPEEVDASGRMVKRDVVDLMAVPDPDLVSLPPIHDGDLGLGDPFTVRCESIEALRMVSRHEILLSCDNNFPNRGRHPVLADDNEFITVHVPDL